MKILLTLFSWSVLYVIQSYFAHLDLWPECFIHSWAIYPSQINQVYNLQYRPQTWVVRDIICTFVGIVAWVIPESCILCTLSSKERLFSLPPYFHLTILCQFKISKGCCGKEKKEKEATTKVIWCWCHKVNFC